MFILGLTVLLHLALSSYWLSSSRFFSLQVVCNSTLSGIFVGHFTPFKFVMLALITLLGLFNLASQVPFSVSPVLYYWFTATLSFCLLLSLFSLTMSSSLSSFVQHLMPYGAPIFLAPILPLIELFSQIIRPFTLIVRLSTNLSSGHIILYMFSFFSILSAPLRAVLLLLVFVLVLMELGISMLQAYIFSSLFYIYYLESLDLI